MIVLHSLAISWTSPFMSDALLLMIAALFATLWIAVDRESAREESPRALLPDVRVCFSTSPVT